MSKISKTKISCGFPILKNPNGEIHEPTISDLISMLKNIQNKTLKEKYFEQFWNKNCHTILYFDVDIIDISYTILCGTIVLRMVL